MIILISLIVISLILLIVLVLGLTKSGWDYEWEAAPGIISFLIGIFIAASIICGGICIGKSIAYEAEVVVIEEKIDYFENRKQMLESVKPVITPDGDILDLTSDIYLHFDNIQDYYKAVDEYNQELKEFKIEIKANKCRRNNLLINWFISPAYDKIGIDRVESLTYSLGK